MLGVDIGNFVLTFLEDLLDLIGGIGDIISILNDLDSLVVGFIDDILDLLLLLFLSFLNTVVLNVLVVGREGLEALGNLLDNHIELVLGADVGDILEGDTEVEGLSGLIDGLFGNRGLLGHIKDNNFVENVVIKVITVGDLVEFLEGLNNAGVKTRAHDSTVIFGEVGFHPWVLVAAVQAD